MDVHNFMTLTDYNRLPWPTRVKLARLALPKATKTALAYELGTTVHTIVNWEQGKCIPKSHNHRLRIKELCEAGVSAADTRLSINFLLGGFDGNETILTQPLLSRDKGAATLALSAIATRLATHIQIFMPDTMFVISADTVFNTYPSYVNLHVTPVELPGVNFIFRLSHFPSGASYNLEFLVSTGEELVSKYVCDISDSNIAKAIRLLKKFINKLKPNGRSRTKQC